jgi:hypothetical protein
VTVTGGPVGERVVELRDLYLAEDGPGVRVAFHPASNSLQARVPDLPPAGVEVCSADVGGSVNDGGCTLILSSDTTPVPVAFSGGGAFHVAVVIRSPKGRATTVGAIHLTYQAADDFFDVTFPSGRSGSGSG